MKNVYLIELNRKELMSVNGGATFAYRVGQLIRGVFETAGNATLVAGWWAEESLAGRGID